MYKNDQLKCSPGKADKIPGVLIMEQKQSIFFRLLGVLTPEVIAMLTTISMGANKLSLTEMILAAENGDKGPAPSNVVLIEDLKKEKVCEKIAEPFDSSIEGVSATILEVKKRLKKSQEKIKESEIYGMYKKSSLVDLNQARKNREDMTKSSNLGVLVNKKQA